MYFLSRVFYLCFAAVTLLFCIAMAMSSQPINRFDELMAFGHWRASIRRCSSAPPRMQPVRDSHFQTEMLMEQFGRGANIRSANFDSWTLQFNICDAWLQPTYYRDWNLTTLSPLDPVLEIERFLLSERVKWRACLLVAVRPGHGPGASSGDQWVNHHSRLFWMRMREDAAVAFYRR